MNYKLTIKDKIKLFFKYDYIYKFCYLRPKVEKWYDDYFKKNNMRFPYNYDDFLNYIVDNLIFNYENELYR